MATHNFMGNSTYDSAWVTVEYSNTAEKGTRIITVKDACPYKYMSDLSETLNCYVYKVILQRKVTGGWTTIESKIVNKQVSTRTYNNLWRGKTYRCYYHYDNTSGGSTNPPPPVDDDPVAPSVPDFEPADSNYKYDNQKNYLSYGSSSLYDALSAVHYWKKRWNTGDSYADMGYTTLGNQYKTESQTEASKWYDYIKTYSTSLMDKVKSLDASGLRTFINNQTYLDYVSFPPTNYEPPPLDDTYDDPADDVGGGGGDPVEDDESYKLYIRNLFQMMGHQYFELYDDQNGYSLKDDDYILPTEYKCKAKFIYTPDEDSSYKYSDNPEYWARDRNKLHEFVQTQLQAMYNRMVSEMYNKYGNYSWKNNGGAVYMTVYDSYGKKLYEARMDKDGYWSNFVETGEPPADLGSVVVDAQFDVEIHTPSKTSPEVSAVSVDLSNPVSQTIWLKVTPGGYCSYPSANLTYRISVFDSSDERIFNYVSPDPPSGYQWVGTTVLSSNDWVKVKYTLYADVQGTQLTDVAEWILPINAFTPPPPPPPMPDLLIMPHVRAEWDVIPNMQLLHTVEGVDVETNEVIFKQTYVHDSSVRWGLSDEHRYHDIINQLEDNGSGLVHGVYIRQYFNLVNWVIPVKPKLIIGLPSIGVGGYPQPPSPSYTDKQAEYIRDALNLKFAMYNLQVRQGALNYTPTNDYYIKATATVNTLPRFEERYYAPKGTGGLGNAYDETGGGSNYLTVTNPVEVRLTAHQPEGENVEFRLKDVYVAMETGNRTDGYGNLTFQLDGHPPVTLPHVNDWVTYSVPVGAGEHTYKWSLNSDTPVSYYGEADIDYVKIDGVEVNQIDYKPPAEVTDGDNYIEALLYLLAQLAKYKDKHPNNKPVEKEWLFT